MSLLLHHHVWHLVNTADVRKRLTLRPVGLVEHLLLIHLSFVHMIVIEANMDDMNMEERLERRMDGRRLSCKRKR